MYIICEIAYADGFASDNIKIMNIQIISNFCMLVTFSNGERKIFDAKYFLKLPAFKKLDNVEIFNSAYVTHDTIVWDNGNIDISPETVYNHSLVYETI